MGTIKDYKEKKLLPPIGILVKTSENILRPDECMGFLVIQKIISERKPNTNGKYIGYVPGSGGELWWIEHEDGTVGAYLFTEINDR